MAKKYFDTLELLEYAAKDKLYAALVLQLKKDFGPANISIEISLVSFVS